MSGPIALRVEVPTPDRGYVVSVEPGSLSSLGERVRAVAPAASRVAVVSDTNVWPLHGGTVGAALEAAGFEVHVQTLAPGEATKTPATLLGLVQGMLRAGLGRRDVAVAVGGGVVGDITGLAAALFMRGIAFVQCPTSLLAQVDASVGGKVAVDLPEGKNLLGVFHFPAAVVIDPDVLRTLSDEELGCGLAEMLKHGALFSSPHWHDLIAHADAIYEREPAVTSRLVADSVALKAACVASDPLEAPGGRRVWLNLGHTVGHAIEQASAFSIKHGQAVGLGLRAAARISARSNLAGPELEAQVVQALTRLRLPTDLDAWLEEPRREVVEEALLHDKKREASTVTYIALRGIADPVVRSLRIAEILGFLRA